MDSAGNSDDSVVPLCALPDELIEFPPIPEASIAIRHELDTAKRASFPWEQIDRLWVVHQIHFKMSYGLDLKVVEIQFNNCPLLHVAYLLVSNVNGQSIHSKAILSRSFSASDMSTARKIVASQALFFLAPHYANGVLRETTPHRILFVNPLNTRDNVFDLNGHTLMEQAMELLTAAKMTLATSDIRRFEGKDEEPALFDRPNAFLTAEFKTLQSKRWELSTAPSKPLYSWGLKNLNEDTAESRAEEDVEALRFTFEFTIYYWDGGEKKPVATSTSHSLGESPTRVIYRGLLAVAGELQCQSMMRELWREFAVTLCPPDCSEPLEYVNFYFEAFFGVHNVAPNLKSADKVVSWKIVGQKKERFALLLSLKRCGGAEELEKNPFLLGKDNTNSTMLTAGSECFSFVLYELTQYLNNFPSIKKNLSESHVNGLRKVLSYMRSAERKVHSSWNLSDSGANTRLPPPAVCRTQKDSCRKSPKAALEGAELLSPGSGISPTSHIAAATLARMMRRDYHTWFGCWDVKHDKQAPGRFLSEVHIHRPNHSVVFLLQGFGNTIEQSFFRSLGKALPILASYRRMVLEAPLIATVSRLRVPTGSGKAAPPGASSSPSARPAETEGEIGEDLDGMMNIVTEES